MKLNVLEMQYNYYKLNRLRIWIIKLGIKLYLVTNVYFGAVKMEGWIFNFKFRVKVYLFIYR